MKHFEFDCELQALICKREAMIFANRELECIGRAPFYSEGCFNLLADDFIKLKNSYLKSKV